MTIALLREIRDEIRSTRVDLGKRIDDTNQRLDATNQRLDATNQRLESVDDRLGRIERRQTEAEVRLSTEIVAVVGAVRQLRDAIVEDRDLRKSVVDHERRIRSLERAKSAGR
ncbi:MAG: hypothetical protein IT379_08085 [Deltaproteobacteria bacterium]|nr:hypothetical protein [Deltaproteobacteria bacterium]